PSPPDVLHPVRMDTQDHWGILLLADLDDAEEHRVIADVEGGHREAVFVRDVQDHLAGCQHVAFLPLIGRSCDQFLTAPDVSPPMNRRWNNRNKMSTGMEPRMLIAIIWFHS